MFSYYSLEALEETTQGIASLPCSLKVLAEKLLFGARNKTTFLEDAQILCAFYASNQKATRRVFFQPTRLVLTARDALGVLGRLMTLVDRKGGVIGPRDFPVSLDVLVDETADFRAHDRESLSFLKYATRRLPRCRLFCAPEDSGLVAGVCGLYDGLARDVAQKQEEDAPLVMAETVFGSPKACAMLGSAGALGFATDALDLEEILLEGGARMALPRVVGVKVTGKGKRDVYATDIGLALVAALAKKNVKDGIVEFFGPGLDQLGFADRAAIAAFVRAKTEARSVFFPPDVSALARLVATGLSSQDAALYEAYAKAQKLWRESALQEQSPVVFSDVVEYSLAGAQPFALMRGAAGDEKIVRAEIAARSGGNARELIAAALLAQKARTKGLVVKPWVRARLMCAPEGLACALLDALALRAPLEELGFVLSKAPFGGEENGSRIGLASKDSPEGTEEVERFLEAPPLSVVAFALAGKAGHDFSVKLLGVSKTGDDVFLKDIAPTEAEIKEFTKREDVEAVFSRWRCAFATEAEQCKTQKEEGSALCENSPYIRPSAIVALSCPGEGVKDVRVARLLAVLEDDAQASAFAPSGAIVPESAAGALLAAASLSPGEFGRFEDYSGNEDVLFAGLDPVWRELGRQEGPLVVVAGKNFGAGPASERAAILARLLGVRFVLAESFAPAWRGYLVKAGILPLLFKSGVNAQALGLRPNDGIAIVGIGKVLRDATSLEVLATFEQADNVNRYMLVCALEDKRELELLKHGGLWGAAYAKDL